MKQQPEAKKLVVQDNAITTARYTMTALEKNIMYMVMAQLDQSDSPTHYYRISGKELMERTRKKIKYEELKEATNRLIEFKFKQAKPQLAVPLPDVNRERLLQRLVTDFRLRQDQAQKIITQYPAQDINKTLYDISLKKKDIANIGAYTAKTFNI